MKKSGLTLLEVMFVVGILVFAIAGLLVGYINCVALNEHDRNFTQAMNIARMLMEEIYNQRGSFNSIVSESIPMQGADGMLDRFNFRGSASIVVSDIMPGDLKEVIVVLCWEERGGNRISGEDDGCGNPDHRLDGIFQECEDTNGDGRLSSSVELISAIARR